jgi:hypothetical protein
MIEYAFLILSIAFSSGLTCNRSAASPTDLLGSLFRILTPEALSRAISCHPHALLADRTDLGEKVGD